MKHTFAVFVLLSVVGITAFGQSIYPPDKESLLKGEPAGRTLVAERNGYLSPEKIIASKDQLNLSKDQLRKIDEMLKNLPVSATVKGQEIVEAEEDLNRAFENGAMTEKVLRAKLERINKLRADLNFAFLQVHLKIKQILSANQWEKVKELHAGEIK